MEAQDWLEIESWCLEIRGWHLLPHDATDGDGHTVAIRWPYSGHEAFGQMLLSHRPCSVCKHAINTSRSLSPEACGKSHAMPTALFRGRSITARCRMSLP